MGINPLNGVSLRTTLGAQLCVLLDIILVGDKDPEQFCHCANVLIHEEKIAGLLSQDYVPRPVKVSRKIKMKKPQDLHSRPMLDMGQEHETLTKDGTKLHLRLSDNREVHFPGEAEH